ncbi:MAG: site-specific DNA-methyltransferase [Acidobacteria bacterium]|nr:site-specific DNA-methyltransferase [Acidobacteriota bacterium]
MNDCEMMPFAQPVVHVVESPPFVFPPEICIEALTMRNKLFYGDNLENLRKKVRDETVDLCYVDPPFNSKRTYNQIYTNVGHEDMAQAQAFVDTWVWDDRAKEGYTQITTNHEGRFRRQTIELMIGLRKVLGEGSLLAYLVSITLRAVEAQRVLKPTGSFYLHCDPTASHYLKIALDGIFCSSGGDFCGEIIWKANYIARNLKAMAANPRCAIALCEGCREGRVQ